VSLAAAIGYAIGIIIFGLFIRRQRRQMIRKHIEKAKSSLKGKQG
jgi:uncharacterized membrane-anchored protein YhcB (DUF1043 family)